uniref:M96 mating-specific protein family n=1 Tax=Hyaloperonospora arabidopsidis (strain Emoy2) TaxID=559515 RepID=M4BVD8_HYAAE
MPRAAFPQDDDDKSDDKDRRNATAHTIVKLLACNSNSSNKYAGHGTGLGQTLPSFRRPSTSSSSSSSTLQQSNSRLPSLPKLLIPSLRCDRRVPLPSTSSTSAFAARTPTTSGCGSPNSLSPAARPMAVLPLAAAAAGTSATAAPASSGPKRGRPATLSKVANNSRKRQKDELTRLRAQVQELQRELEHVRLRMPRHSGAITYRTTDQGRERGEQSLQSPVTGTPTATAGTLGELLDTVGKSAPAYSRLVVVPVWERMAQHQKEEKSKAEMENLRLKGLIQEQLKISKGLEKLLRKRCKSSMSSGSDAETSSTVLGGKRLYTSKAEESAVYASLASGLESRLAEMDAVFEKGGLSREKQELQEAQMILDERRGPVMEVKDAKILPFDVKACAAAVWQSMKAESEATVVDGATRDTLCFKSRLPLRQHRAPEVELIVRCVIRRDVEKISGRVVFVWESVAECPDRMPLVSCSAKGLKIRDCGWGLLESLRTSTGEQSSILQLCSYLVPQLCGVSAEQSRQHISALAELVAPCYRGLWNQRQRNMENKLMNGAISAKKNHAALNIVLKQEAACCDQVFTTAPHDQE